MSLDKKVERLENQMKVKADHIDRLFDIINDLKTTIARMQNEIWEVKDKVFDQYIAKLKEEEKEKDKCLST